MSLIMPNHSEPTNLIKSSRMSPSKDWGQESSSSDSSSEEEGVARKHRKYSSVRNKKNDSVKYCCRFCNKIYWTRLQRNQDYCRKCINLAKSGSNEVSDSSRIEQNTGPIPLPTNNSGSISTVTTNEDTNSSDEAILSLEFEQKTNELLSMIRCIRPVEDDGSRVGNDHMEQRIYPINNNNYEEEPFPLEL